MMNRNNGEGLAGDLLKGTLAGLAATWVMGQATAFLYEHEGKSPREQEDEARGGQTAYGVAAEKTAALLDRSLEDEERQRCGSAIHWILGAGAGAAYGALRDRLPGGAVGRGLLFGAGFWAVVDEGANTALGLTPGPTAFPWQTHARGLAGHLVFGVAAEASLRLLEEVA